MQFSDWVENIAGKEEIARNNFFFSRYVFRSCLLLMRKNEYLWSKGLMATLIWPFSFRYRSEYVWQAFFFKKSDIGVTAH